MLGQLLCRASLIASFWSWTDALSWSSEELNTQIPLLEHQSHHDGLDTALLEIERGGDVDNVHVSSTTMQALLHAINVMQDHYYEVWVGTWPDAIDWTAAVMGTQVSGALAAISRSRHYDPYPAPFGGVSGNTVAGYFSHVSSFYFGENAFALRLQAYDDMLWVVLGWLEAIQFIQTHSDHHYDPNDGNESAWFAKHFIPAFAHRARIFWDLAHKGWDTTLCGGGMVWNPRLTPYKNAITNELYIAASISMYLHFPGDDNGVPFSQSVREEDDDDDDELPRLPPIEPHDERYLTAAVEAYDWLAASGMTNVQGLYVDGFHITGWERGKSNGTRKCDARNNMVYTYNQGVILTGQRGLWRATGNTSYLDDGHRLIDAVIKATGWQSDGAHFPFWAGLGSFGVMEERCDARGRCSQDGQTFKGIFFHHLATFCAPLPTDGDESITYPADPDLRRKHARRCAGYAPWVARNARAAAGTRDAAGRFGEWWTVGLRDVAASAVASAAASAVTSAAAMKQGHSADDDEEEDDMHAEDIRNQGIPPSPRWQLGQRQPAVCLPGSYAADTGAKAPTENTSGDPNRRGRGRTLETQAGGVAVLKAMYAMVDRRLG